MGNLVAIVGRPNVGKSTLFNRLTDSRKAIVDETAGVTRDRHYGDVEWNGRTFNVVDTGGYVTGSGDVFEKEIRRQVETAISESDLLLFLVDVTSGITAYDEAVADLLRRSGKETLLVVNKVDNGERLHDVAQFYRLGFKKLFGIASISGSGTGELLDAVVESLGPEKEEENLSGIPRIAIIGQPNVGKSSLLNQLIGEERTIVTPVAGTTRDSIHQRYKAFGFDFLLIDTAGLRKKAKVHEDLEFYSVLRTIRVIEESDVCLLLLDATEGIEAQDLSIIHLVEKNRKGLVILVNKWDLVKDKTTQSAKYYEEAIKRKTAPFTDIPVIFTSVVEKQRIHKALEMALKVHENRKQRIKTSVLNETIQPIIEHYPPPAVKGKDIRIKYITQLPGQAPIFAFFCNHPQYINEPYRRYLENQMREKFDFKGVPVTIYFRKKGD